MPVTMDAFVEKVNAFEPTTLLQRTPSLTRAQIITELDLWQQRFQALFEGRDVDNQKALLFSQLKLDGVEGYPAGVMNYDHPLYRAYALKSRQCMALRAVYVMIPEEINSKETMVRLVKLQSDIDNPPAGFPVLVSKADKVYLKTLIKAKKETFLQSQTSEAYTYLADQKIAVLQARQREFARQRLNLTPTEETKIHTDRTNVERKIAEKIQDRNEVEAQLDSLASSLTGRASSAYRNALRSQESLTEAGQALEVTLNRYNAARFLNTDASREYDRAWGEVETQMQTVTALRQQLANYYWGDDLSDLRALNQAFIAAEQTLSDTLGALQQAYDGIDTAQKILLGETKPTVLSKLTFVNVISLTLGQPDALGFTSTKVNPAAAAAGGAPPAGIIGQGASVVGHHLVSTEVIRTEKTVAGTPMVIEKSAQQTVDKTDYSANPLPNAAQEVALEMAFLELLNFKKGPNKKLYVSAQTNEHAERIVAALLALDPTLALTDIVCSQITLPKNEGYLSRAGMVTSNREAFIQAHLNQCAAEIGLKRDELNTLKAGITAGYKKALEAGRLPVVSKESPLALDTPEHEQAHNRDPRR